MDSVQTKTSTPAWQEIREFKGGEAEVECGVSEDNFFVALEEHHKVDYGHL